MASEKSGGRTQQDAKKAFIKTSAVVGFEFGLVALTLSIVSPFEFMLFGVPVQITFQNTASLFILGLVASILMMVSTVLFWDSFPEVIRRGA